MVQPAHEQLREKTKVSQSKRKSNPARKPQQSSAVKPMPLGGMPFVGEKLLRQGFDRPTVDLMMKAYRDSTKKSYTVYLKKWAFYCLRNKVSLMNPSLPQGCTFLRELSQRGLKYSAINSARSALSAMLPLYDGKSFGSNPAVVLLCRGASTTNPSKGRYTGFWDVVEVLELFQEWGQNEKLSLKVLTYKVVMLLLLITAQRGQTILNLSLQDAVFERDEVTFFLQTLLKHNRAGDSLDVITLNAFDADRDVCVVDALHEYVKRTKDLRFKDKVKSHNHQLLVSYVFPYGPVSRATLSHWTVEVLDLAGVSVQKYGGKKFGSHSTRGASTSKAKRLGVPLNLIMKQAAWRNASSFAKFYDKRIDAQPQYGEAILQAAVREKENSKKRKKAN